jgi:hypothetical protein
MHEAVRQFDVTDRVEHHETRDLERVAFRRRKRGACCECEIEPGMTNSIHRFSGVIRERISIGVREGGYPSFKNTLQRGHAPRDLALLILSGCEGQRRMRHRMRTDFD